MRTAARFALGLVVCMWTSVVSLGAEFQVCSPPLDEFIEFTFPKNNLGDWSGQRLLKYAHPPKLIVLAPAKKLGLKDTVTDVFARIAKDSLRTPLDSSFDTYESFEQAGAKIDHLGGHGIFVIIADPLDPSLKPGELRSVLEKVLGSRAKAEKLASDSESNPGYLANNTINILTGEVISTASVVSPNYDDTRIGLAIYAAYYFALSPGATSLGDFYSRVFEGSFDGTLETGITLTEFGREYFRTFSDRRVVFGMTPKDFVECPNQ
ncbi:MAG TPA: hypothetical protein VJV39_05525 [Dongiaceae bacterium]|nr:hypothetical protein [Dongiaceae bacterium]